LEPRRWAGEPSAARHLERRWPRFWPGAPSSPSRTGCTPPATANRVAVVEDGVISELGSTTS